VYPEFAQSREEWQSRFLWLNNQNPAGPGLTFVAECEGKIVGQTAFVALDIRIGDKVVRAAQNIDLMTHPDYRGRGIRSKLEAYGLEEVKKAGFAILVGFTHEAAFRGHLRAGWIDVGRMQSFVKPLNWSKAVRLKVRNKLASELLAVFARLAFRMFRENRQVRATAKVRPIRSFDARIDVLCAKKSSKVPLMVARTGSHLNWRYGGPGEKYSAFVAEEESEITGYIVLKEVEQGDMKLLLIFDLIALSPIAAHSLILEATEISRLEGNDLII